MVAPSNCSRDVLLKSGCDLNLIVRVTLLSSREATGISRTANYQRRSEQESAEEAQTGLDSRLCFLC